MYYLIPLGIGIISLILFLVFRVKQKRVIAVWLKGFTSLMFIATALVAWLTNKNPHSTFGIFVIIGLFFGLLGDVFLDLKFMSKDKDDMYTRLGFISFGIGHILFITGLFVNFFNFGLSVLYIILPVIITLVFVGLVLIMEKVSPIKYQKMRPFVVAYGFILFLAVTLYMSAAIQSGWQIRTIWMFAIALSVFAISDLILNNTYFAPGYNTPAFIISNHIVYYAAQFTIAVSLTFLL